MGEICESFLPITLLFLNEIEAKSSSENEVKGRAVESS